LACFRVSVWRHRNGAKWRAIPEDPGPWWRAAQIFLRWSRASGCSACPSGSSATAATAAAPWRPHILDKGARPAIPPQRHEAPVACPDWIHDNRNQVERLWARLEEWRAIATRYEKTAVSFIGVLRLAAAIDWLKR